MRSEMIALIQKDWTAFTANKRLLLTLYIIPVVLTVFLPTIFILTFHFAPQELTELQPLLDKLPSAGENNSLKKMAAGLIVNHLLPVFFLIIPIMAASFMSASSFVGEKEKHTLETLLYCPLSLKQIFQAKVLASFLVSMTVSLISFLLMITVTETEMYILSGSFLQLDILWLPVMLLLSPAISLIAITLIVRFSAKARSVEDAQQGAVFLILPVILLIAGQFTGILLVDFYIVLLLSIISAAVAWLLLHKAMGALHYEELL